MTAVNMQLMPSNMSLDFLPMHSHSRSASVSSNSTHSNHSRPQSSQGNINRMQQPAMSPSAEDLFRASYNLGHHNLVQNDSVCLFLFLPAHVVNGWFSASATPKSQCRQSLTEGPSSSQSYQGSSSGLSIPSRYR